MRIAKTLLCMAVVAFIVALSTMQRSTQGSTLQRKFKHEAKIRAQYDEASNKTVVAMWPYVVESNYNDPAESIAITAGITFPNKSQTSPPQYVEFGVLSQSSSGWLFDKDRKLEVIVNSESLPLGEMKLVTARTFNTRRLYYREDLAIPLPYDVLVKIVSSDKVVMRVGRQKLQLRKEHLEALRDLVSRISA
ncbi:MAG: hypothetical protein M3458_20975 [Acidobacteriota bacterium]|nr:hypothetical protein [Acidobacteriota bacterium]